MERLELGRSEARSMTAAVQQPSAALQCGAGPESTSYERADLLCTALQ